MFHWIDPEPVSTPASFSSLNLSPLLLQALLRRGISTVDAARGFLDPQYRHPSDPGELPGMQAAVDRLFLAMRKEEPVCVWGDFDVDGQTSTALLVETLRTLGVEVSWHIPVRAVSSHGVHIPELADLIERGARLILTCDTGITANEAVDYARERDVDFIITDHHELSANLPEAAAVVNPKILPGDHPQATLAGVGVAFKLAEAILRGTGHDRSKAATEAAISSLLDLVALGLIADVALLQGETRALVQMGLETLRHSKRLGLKLMAELAGQPLTQADEDYVGFVLAPRLNALGRLGDANPAVELLISDDTSRTRVLATQLEGLNMQRRLLTSQVYQAAEAQLQADPALLERPAIVLAHPSWPGGVIGIVAGRLRERYNKPVILFSCPPDEPARGSARSVEGLHITEAIAAQADLLQSYGGHPMAAGLSLPQENLGAFHRRLDRTIQHMLGEKALQEPTLFIDAWLELEALSTELATEIEQLAPFGAGNPPLTFATRNLSLRGVRALGAGGEHLRLNIEDGNGKEQAVVWWNGADESMPQGRFDLAYTLRARWYHGQRNLSLQFVDFRQMEEQATEVRGERIEVIDLRHDPDALKKLAKLAEDTTITCYAEGPDRSKLDRFPPFKGESAVELALFTLPPGPTELKALLKAAQPHRIYLVAQPPPSEGAQAWLSQLAGMAKYAIAHRAGRTSLQDLAISTAQREITVRLGVEWLAASGHVTVTVDDGQLLLAEGNGVANKTLRKELFTAIKGLVAETAAYRHFAATMEQPAALFDR